MDQQTTSQNRSRPQKFDPLPLAQYFSIADYMPQIGDFVVWAGWIRTWYGVVSNVSDNGNMVSIIFDGLPYLLLTQTDDEQIKNTRIMDIRQIKASSHGKWSIQKHDKAHNATIWFV